MKLIPIVALLAAYAKAQAQLQYSNYNLTTACQTDTNCTTVANYCCAQVSSMNLTNVTAGWINVNKTCLPYDINARSLVANGLNYTWNCTNSSSAITTYKSG